MIRAKRKADEARRIAERLSLHVPRSLKEMILRPPHQMGVELRLYSKMHR
jgi:hypothetical protein